VEVFQSNGRYVASVSDGSDGYVSPADQETP